MENKILIYHILKTQQSIVTKIFGNWASLIWSSDFLLNELINKITWLNLAKFGRGGPSGSYLNFPKLKLR